MRENWWQVTLETSRFCKTEGKRHCTEAQYSVGDVVAAGVCVNSESVYTLPGVRELSKWKTEDESQVSHCHCGRLQTSKGNKVGMIHLVQD